MIYVFDTNVFSQFYRSYYPDIFPSLHQKFDQLVANGQITSTREVMRELQDGAVAEAREWADRNCNLFPMPSAAEAQFVRRILREFQNNIGRKQILKGGRNADPFVIARAKILNATVVTLERKSKQDTKSAKIPNICQHFEIPCASLEEFMELENWTF